MDIVSYVYTHDHALQNYEAVIKNEVLAYYRANKQ